MYRCRRVNKRSLRCGHLKKKKAFPEAPRIEMKLFPKVRARAVPKLAPRENREHINMRPGAKKNAKHKNAPRDSSSATQTKKTIQNCIPKSNFTFQARKENKISHKLAKTARFLRKNVCVFERCVFCLFV